MSIEVLDIVTGVLGVALLLAVSRALRGPSLPDRVVALELVSMVSVSILMLRTIRTDEGYFVDIAVVLALVAFLSSVSLAYYLERRPPE